MCIAVALDQASPAGSPGTSEARRRSGASQAAQAPARLVPLSGGAALRPQGRWWRRGDTSGRGGWRGLGGRLRPCWGGRVKQASRSLRARRRCGARARDNRRSARARALAMQQAAVEDRGDSFMSRPTRRGGRAEAQGSHRGRSALLAASVRMAHTARPAAARRSGSAAAAGTRGSSRGRERERREPELDC